jgi:hypothetical protein
MSEYFDNREWLQSRLGRFTASEIHKLSVPGKKKGEIFGVGAMTYIRTKAAEILTQEVKDEVDFKQAEWGKAHEAEACAAFESWLGTTGVYYGGGNPVFFEYGDFEGCSPDWEIEEEVGADMKCPYNSAEHMKNLLLESAEDLAKERWEYYCQLQYSMLIRGWKVAYFVSYDPRFVYDWMKLKVIQVYPDPEWLEDYSMRIPLAIEELKEMVRKFSNPVILASHDNQVGATIIEKV